MRSSRYRKTLIKNILNSSFNTAECLLIDLIEMGEITADTFLSTKRRFASPSCIFFVSKNERTRYLKEKTEIKEKTAKQSLKRMEKQGFLERKGKIYLLSKKGLELVDYIMGRKKILRKKWDGKYRVVIFDIPEKKKECRDWLREELYLLNYVKLQKSVFISKYPLTGDLLKEVKNRGIFNYINYLLADKVYDESKLGNL
ncbi:MAG: hypothetical protein V1804_00020 [Patescibacteria group bacterium]